jgi:hypothetical protein
VIDVVTNLVGEIVEIYEYRDYGSAPAGYSLRARGTARAVYVVDKELRMLVEHNLGYDSATYYDRTKDGGFEMYSFHEGRVRVVERCGRCLMWDQKALLSAVYPGEGVEKRLEHRDGEGCKRAGHDGPAGERSAHAAIE